MPPPAPGVQRFSKRFAEEWLYRAALRELARAFVGGCFRTAPDAYDRRLLERCANELLEATYLGEPFAGRYLRRSRLFRTDDLAPTA